MLYMGVFKCWKTVEFLKISMKIRNCKTFSEPKRRATLRKSFCVTPNDPSLDKILLRLWNKISLTGIYRNIQTFAFKELEECSSWASRNGAVQMFFWHQTETCLLEKFLSQKGFWLYCGSMLLSTPSELRFVKWVRFFERNCIVNWVIFFASFVGFEGLCWKIWNEKNSDDHMNIWTNIKVVCLK